LLGKNFAAVLSRQRLHQERSLNAHTIGRNVRIVAPSVLIIDLIRERRISMHKPTMKTIPESSRTVAPEDRQEEIRRRAYELYEERGRADGHDVEDWLRAEAEITGRSERGAA
jgi:Protein of unknown function (DUF2934)